jgi:hypothetical protein
VRRLIAIRTCGAIALAVALLLCAAPASAKTVTYGGEGVNLKPGQTKGLPILIVFELHGRGCPSGTHCFEHATVSKFNVVSWAYPNCTEVLDSYFTLARSFRVERGAPHGFSLSSPSDDYPQDHVTMDGRFLRHGKMVKGTFTVTDGPCSTDTVDWTAAPE